MFNIEAYVNQGKTTLAEAELIRASYPDAEFIGVVDAEIILWSSPTLKPEECNFVYALAIGDRMTLQATRRFGKSMVVLRDRFADHKYPLNAALQIMRNEQPALHAELLSFIAGQQL